MWKRLLLAVCVLLFSASARAQSDELFCDAIASGTMTPEVFAEQLKKIYEHARIDAEELAQIGDSGDLFQLPVGKVEGERAQAQIILSKLAPVAKRLDIENALVAIVRAQVTGIEIPRALKLKNEAAVKRAQDVWTVLINGQGGPNVSDFHLSPDGQTLIVEGEETIHAFSTADGNKYSDNLPARRPLGFGSDSQSIWTHARVWGQERIVRLSLDGKALPEEEQLASTAVNGKQFMILPSSQGVVYLSSDKSELHMAKLGTKKLTTIKTNIIHEHAIESLTVSPNERYAIVKMIGHGRNGPWDRTLHIFDLREKKSVDVRHFGEGNIKFVSFVPGTAKDFVYIDTDGVGVYRSYPLKDENDTLVTSIPRQSNGLAVAPDGKWLVVSAKESMGGNDHETFTAYSVVNSSQLIKVHVKAEGSFETKAIRFSPDGQSIYQLLVDHQDKIRILKWNVDLMIEGGLKP